MNDHRLARMTDDVLDRDIASALAVDPSPEFVARVRTRVASERPSVWPFATFRIWRTASASRWALSFAGGAVVAVALVYAVVLLRPVGSKAPVVTSTLARTTSGPAEAGRRVPIPTETARHVPGSPSSPPATQRSAHPELVEGRDPALLLDPRETAALRSLIAGVRDNRVDLTPLLQPGAPAPMELPPVNDLVIAPIAIEPLTPQGGAQGERQ
jgi:hypothetical protein